MRTRRLLALAATAAALTLVATGCSANDSNATSSASPSATSDNSLVLYSGRSEDLIGPLVEKFTQKTGIEVDVRYGSTGEMAALLQEEGDRTPAQVFLSQDAGALGGLASDGLVATLPATIVDAVPAEFTSTDDSWVGVTGRARVIAYDSQQLTEADVPSSVDGLVDPMWNGQIAFPPGNASFQAFVTALRILEGEDAAEAWVAGIAANNPVLTEKNGQTMELVNTGAAKLALINHYYWYEAAAEVGRENMRVQLKFLPKDPGGMVNVTGAAIPLAAKDDPDALAFVEYLLSDEAQTYFAEVTYEYPLVPGVAVPEGLPALDTLVNPGLDLSDLTSLPKTQELLAAHGLI